MSSHRVPPFDLLSEQATPYSGFGDLLAESPERLQNLRMAAEDARNRIEECFGRKLDKPSLLPQELDDILGDMWSHGWSPDTGNVNLFATDFGLVLTSALLSMYHGRTIFRSENDISHLSIWWSDCRVEVFPFHHLLKCLYDREGNSVMSFAQGLAEQVLKCEGDARQD